MEGKKQDFLRRAIVIQEPYDLISKKLGVPRSTLSLWWEDLKEEREELSSIRQLWKRKCEDLDFDSFERWYKTTPRQCHYCTITEDQIKKLIDADKIETKRIKTRGRKLEIERLKPNEKYDVIENLVYSCYWCNNAKTDEFTEEEFKLIGEEIQKVWEKRLDSI